MKNCNLQIKKNYLCSYAFLVAINSSLHHKKNNNVQHIFFLSFLAYLHHWSESGLVLEKSVIFIEKHKKG